MRIFIFRTRKIETSQVKWYPMSEPFSTISGNPTDRHGFAIVHNTNIVPCDISVDGALRHYLAYDSDHLGNQIRLYYSNEINSVWKPYSRNPILNKGTCYRTPSVSLIYGVFQMFLNNINDHNIERWTSTDGINFNYAERVLRTSYDVWTNPFVWLNPNDDFWYLFWSRGTNNGKKWSIMGRKSRSITGFAGKHDTAILKSTLLEHLAYPTITFNDGYYWLLTETGLSNASSVNWHINAFISSSILRDYKQCSNSPILTNDEACPQIFKDDKGKCYLFTNSTSVNNVWNQETRKVYF
jgi:hypothetical protein